MTLKTSRRTVLGTASILALVRTAFPSGASAQSKGSETIKARLGYIALTDSAPLIVAKEKGLFAKHGVPDVEVLKQVSWGGTRDIIVLGDGSGGIDPDKDVETIVVPPPQMVANMKDGTMDAFCVGEPGNDQLVNQSMGYTACVTGEIWKDHPEKSLALRADFVAANPRAAAAMTAAVIEAHLWCDVPANKAELSTIPGKRAWFNVPPAARWRNPRC